MARQRATLDAELRKLERSIAILFVDMMGTTEFFDCYGDLAGLARMEKFVERVRTAVEHHGGTVAKTAGDILLTWFDDPAQSVRASIQLLQELRKRNEAPETFMEEMHLQVGLNYGPALIKDKEPFGHAVKLAARIKSIACSDQILISALLEERVRDAGFRLRKVSDAAALPGGEQVEVFEVLWREMSGEFRGAEGGS